MRCKICGCDLGPCVYIHNSPSCDDYDTPEEYEEAQIKYADYLDFKRDEMRERRLLGDDK